MISIDFIMGIICGVFFGMICAAVIAVYARKKQRGEL